MGCDLVEDIAIAYGYNNLHLEVPMTFAGAGEQPVNHLADLLRQELACAGFVECLNWALVSRKENFTMLRREEKLEELWRPVANPHEYCPSLGAVTLGNSSHEDFELVRTSLLPGLLKTMGSNKGQQLPVRLFEVGDCVVQEPTREVGCKNVRRVAALYANTKSQFAVIHGALDQLMYSLGFEPEHESTTTSKRRTFTLVPGEDPTFFPGMQANIVVDGIVIGVMGELHPAVVSSQGFNINLPTCAFEINMEPFLEWL